MMKNATLITAGALAILFASCSKNADMNITPAGSNNNTTTGNGTAAQAKMSYTLTASNTAAGIAQKGTAASTIQWTAGFANPTLIKFEATQGGVEKEFKSTNTAQIDLFASIASVFGNFTLPAGTYDEVELKVQLDKNGSSPAVQLTGTFTNSSSMTTPVSFVVNEAVEIETEATNITIDSSTFNAVTTLDLSTLTAGITETMLQNAQRTNGTIVISSSSSNKDLYQAILATFINKRHHAEVEHHH